MPEVGRRFAGVSLALGQGSPGSSLGRGRRRGFGRGSDRGSRFGFRPVSGTAACRAILSACPTKAGIRPISGRRSQSLRKDECVTAVTPKRAWGAHVMGAPRSSPSEVRPRWVHQDGRDKTPGGFEKLTPPASSPRRRGHSFFETAAGPDAPAYLRGGPVARQTVCSEMATACFASSPYQPSFPRSADRNRVVLDGTPDTAVLDAMMSYR